MTSVPEEVRLPGDDPAGGASPTSHGSVTVRMPSQLRSLTGGASEVFVEAGTVREIIAAVEDAHPGVEARLLDEQGALRRFVNIFVADEDVRFLDGLDTPVAEGKAVSVIPAVAGG